MNKLKFSTASDGVFIFFLCFFISYGIIKANAFSIATSTLLSACFSALATFIFIALNSQKQKLKEDKLNKIELLTAFNKYLYSLTDKEVITLISNYLDKIGVTYQIKNSNIYFKDKKTLLAFYFTPDKISLSTCLEFYKKSPKNYNLIILCCDYDDKIIDFFKDFERVKIETTNHLYTALEDKNLLPTLKVIKKEKIPFKRLIARFLRRENVKKFFIWGAMLTLFSTISYYKLFYVFMGAIFLILSAYLKFFKSKA